MPATHSPINTDPGLTGNVVALGIDQTHNVWFAFYGDPSVYRLSSDGQSWASVVPIPVVPSDFSSIGFAENGDLFADGNLPGKDEQELATVDPATGTVIGELAGTIGFAVLPSGVITVKSDGSVAMSTSPYTNEQLVTTVGRVSPFAHPVLDGSSLWLWASTSTMGIQLSRVDLPSGQSRTYAIAGTSLSSAVPPLTSGNHGVSTITPLHLDPGIEQIMPDGEGDLWLACLGQAGHPALSKFTPAD
ncbi:MAG: hypothetical protein ACXVQW_08795 [Actinomycetota bacterium]